MKTSIRKNIFSFISGGLIIGIVTTTTALTIMASNVNYAPKDKSWNVHNVKEAIDDLQDIKEHAFTDGLRHWDFSYKGSEDSFTVPSTGKYKLEVWGAQGGSYDSTYHGGYGGYSKGYISLNKGDVLYINVGGKGLGGTSKTADYNGGYNGGGAAYHWKNNNVYVMSGGGASHIATKSGKLNTLNNSVGNILIVAGGGGGAYYYSTGENSIGGSGGGAIGSAGSENSGNASNGKSGLGGTQSIGGKPGVGNGTAPQSGTFGQGGNSSSSSTAGGSGGGGGFYGGSGSTVAGAGGGSGYIGSESLILKYMVCYNCTSSRNTSEKTLSSSCYDSSAIEDCSKENDGYVRITYMGI